MNKKWIIAIVALLIVGGILVYFFFGRNTNAPQSDYTPSRISANTTIDNRNNINSYANNNNSTSNANTIQSKPKTETKISSFSTPIVDNHKNRINNIKITCSRISGTTVSAGEEFSFCEVVGQPSAEDGYKEAHAFVDGELVNAIGGGKLPS